MKYLLLITLTFFCSYAFSQTPEEGLRTAWFTQNGTARTNAVGGAIGSLGGDLTAANINPAGLGMYKTSEFVLSLGALKNNNSFDFRGTTSNNDKGIFRYGPMGFVIGSPTSSNKKSGSIAFSLSVNQLASYNNRLTFSGYNNYSSFSEQFIEELTRDNADTNAALSNYIFGSTLAFRTYLVDTLNDAAGKFVGYKSLVPITSGVNQYCDAITKGGYHEIAIGVAGSERNKWYYGGSLIIPLVSYQRILDYSEYDATNNTNNKFGYFKFNETLKSFGVGLGLKLGTIYRPNENVRLGLAFHTPQFIGFKDRIRASMTTNTENLKGTLSETSNALNDNNPGERSYTITTPYRAIASASYFFSNSENVKQQRGFISTDVEFVNYRGVRFSKTNEYGESVKGYYKTLNNTIKEIYKGNINVKVGGEIKFYPIAVRLGAAYYGSPYQDETIKADRFVLTGGLGYRAKGMFIDLSFSQAVVNEVQFPYRLNDVANTYAVQTGNTQTVMMTVGFKL
ncbi:MAG: outer membrane protein transport protein [Bacteroidetes bacterium]|jgi:long-subunit fatty acid transport protein|nr:outer membrane protein transport protein [Bacteroidota bacterium]